MYRIRKNIMNIKIKNYNKKIEKEAIEENKKILDEKLKKVITAKEKFEEKNAKILKNREAKRKEPYKIRYNKNKNAKCLYYNGYMCSNRVINTVRRYTIYILIQDNERKYN